MAPNPFGALPALSLTPFAIYFLCNNFTKKAFKVIEKFNKLWYILAILEGIK
jgi:hypothetical protein